MHYQPVPCQFNKYKGTGPAGAGVMPVYRQLARKWRRHQPSSRMSLHPTRPAITFPVAQHSRPLTPLIDASEQRAKS